MKYYITRDCQDKSVKDIGVTYIRGNINIPLLFNDFEDAKAGCSYGDTIDLVEIKILKTYKNGEAPNLPSEVEKDGM